MTGLTNQIRNAARANGWETILAGAEDAGTITFGKRTPAGEHYSFDVTFSSPEEIPDLVRAKAIGFDPGTHVDMMLVHSEYVHIPYPVEQYLDRAEHMIDDLGHICRGLEAYAKQNPDAVMEGFKADWYDRKSRITEPWAYPRADELRSSYGNPCEFAFDLSFTDALPVTAMARKVKREQEKAEKQEVALKTAMRKDAEEIADNLHSLRCILREIVPKTAENDD